MLNCLLLILLVLIQLPKKEAGAGIAFGGAATDALFGAGTGNVLTKVTKYATVVFFLLAMVLSVMQSNYYHSDTRKFQRQVERAGKQPPQAVRPAPSSTPALNPVVAPETSNALTPPPLVPTNPPPAPK